MAFTWQFGQDIDRRGVALYREWNSNSLVHLHLDRQTLCGTDAGYWMFANLYAASDLAESGYALCPVCFRRMDRLFEDGG